MVVGGGRQEVALRRERLRFEAIREHLPFGLCGHFGQLVPGLDLCGQQQLLVSGWDSVRCKACGRVQRVLGFYHAFELELVRPETYRMRQGPAPAVESPCQRSGYILRPPGAGGIQHD